MHSQQPAQRIERLAALILEREGRQGDAQHHIGVLAAGRGEVVAVAIAIVGHRDIARLQAEVGQLFRPFAIGDQNLAHARLEQVVGQMGAPIVATAADLAQAGGIDQ